MTLTATPLSAASTAPRERTAPAPVLGGEAWVVPFEPGGHPWLTGSAPQFAVTDRRAAAPGQRAS